MNEKIVIVEDEADIRELLAYNLEREGYHIREFADGKDALDYIEKHPPELILLDLMLPGMHGLDICRRLKRSHDTENLPIIMVSAKGEESDIITGLELGADDYICKPFSMKILLARVRTALRRRSLPRTAKCETLHAGPLVINPQSHRVTMDGRTIELTASEFAILRFLAQHPGWVRTREQIIDAIRGTDYAVTERAIDVQIVGLRRKLGNHSHLLETVRGVGYRFQETI
jgi:two-component system phosphate regulon response regulator PhoB